MYNGLHVKYPSFLPDFNKTWIFWADFGKIIEDKILWKSWQPSYSLRPDRQTDRQTWRNEGNSRFSSSLQTHFKYVLLQFYVGCCTSLYRSFATRVSQFKICHLWVIGIERNVCRCTFNRYSVIMQFANSPLDSSCVVIAITENYST